MLYAIFAVMFLIALAAVVLPVWRRQVSLPVATGAVVLTAFLLSILLYARIGSPDADSARPGDVPDIEEMVASLAARLEEQPDDVVGWKMLGRSSVQLGNFPGAIAAFERAVELENGRDAQTLADLGEVLLLGDRATLNGRAGDLFDNALAISPGNQKALFYAGMAAIQRGDRALAATHWETLLATSPPENIAAILREQVAELRGEPASAGAITVSVALAPTAAAASPPDATVFIIARDPAQPSPPLAAVRRKVTELPAEVEISDADAMIPGRVPSAFSELEIIARVSLSGQPMAQPGDWFGQVIASRESPGIAIVIDQQVP